MSVEVNEILENVISWDTCPEDYKTVIKKHLEKHQQKQVLIDMTKGDEELGIYDSKINVKEVCQSKLWECDNQTHNCPTCRSECEIGGEGETHYFIPRNNLRPFVAELFKAKTRRDFETKLEELRKEFEK